MDIEYIDYGAEKIPERFYSNDAGLDVAAVNDITIQPHSSVKVPIGFGLKLPATCMALLLPRSGMSSKGITTHPAPVDSTYTGEIHAIMYNSTDEPYEIKSGDRIAQLVIIPVVIANLVPQMKTRGGNGFGSTGK